jgi:protein-disulfide isomerase
MNMIKDLRSGQANKTTVWFIAGFLVLVTAGVIIAGAYGSSSSTNNTGFVSTTAPAINSSDHTLGNPNAKVSLIEYGDFECPACGQYNPVVKQVVANYSSTVIFVFRNFPLYTIHPVAGISSQAAEAAALQGKYWQMNDILYTKQTEWSTTDPTQVVAKYFDGYATSLGLDVTKFNNDISSKGVMDKISNDVTGANTASVDHTPTFFVDLKQIQNPTSYADFKATLDAVISATQRGSITVGSSTATTSSK